MLHQATSPIDLSLDIFIIAKEAVRCTPRTIETYRFTLERFRDWLATQGVGDARQITPHHIRLFLAGLDKQGRAASYIHIHAPVIKTWVRFLHAEDLIPSDPMQRVAMPRLDKTILPAFTTDDVKHLLGACTTERDRALVLCLLDSGCRAAELVGLNIGDVDAKSGAVTIHQGKGGKSRSAVIGATTLRIVLVYREWLVQTRGQDVGDHDPVWRSLNTGRALTISGISAGELASEDSPHGNAGLRGGGGSGQRARCRSWTASRRHAGSVAASHRRAFSC